VLVLAEENGPEQIVGYICKVSAKDGTMTVLPWDKEKREYGAEHREFRFSDTTIFDAGGKEGSTIPIKEIREGKPFVAQRYRGIEQEAGKPGKIILEQFELREISRLKGLRAELSYVQTGKLLDLKKIVFLCQCPGETGIPGTWRIEPPKTTFEVDQESDHPCRTHRPTVKKVEGPGQLPKDEK
jgi:hypothetical protein